MVIRFLSRKVSCSRKFIWILGPEVLKLFIVLILIVQQKCSFRGSLMTVPRSWRPYPFFFLTLVGPRVCFLPWLPLETSSRIHRLLRRLRGLQLKVTDSGVPISCCYTTCWVALGRWFTSVSLSFPMCKVRFYVQSYLGISIFTLAWLFSLLQSLLVLKPRSFAPLPWEGLVKRIAVSISNF